MELSWSTLIFAVYFGLSVLLVFCLGIIAWRARPSSSKTAYLRTVWSMRDLYGSVLVHLYDTSTDIGVLVAWISLAMQPQSTNINMWSFVVPSIVLIFAWRIIYAVYYYKFLHGTVYFSCCDIIWILSDFYIIKVVYQSFQHDYIEPCIMQKNLQFWESLFESIPQLVLQTVFLIKSYDTVLDEDSSSSNAGHMALIVLSITASTLSVVTKFIWYDRNWVNDTAKALCLPNSCCVSWPYVARVLWRFCELMTRFTLFALMWAVLGGIYLILYLGLSWLVYFVLEYCTTCASWITLKLAKKEEVMESRIVVLMLVLQSLLGLPMRCHLRMNVIRWMDNMIAIVCIAWVTLQKIGSVGCTMDVLCNNTVNKYAAHNPYIEILFIFGCVTLALQILLYLALYLSKVLLTEMKNEEFDNASNKELVKKFHPVFVDRALQKKARPEHEMEIEETEDAYYESAANVIRNKQIALSVANVFHIK